MLGILTGITKASVFNIIKYGLVLAAVISLYFLWEQNGSLNSDKTKLESEIQTQEDNHKAKLLELETEYKANLQASEEENKLLREELFTRDELQKKHAEELEVIQANLNNSLRQLDKLKGDSHEVKTWADTEHPNDIKWLLQSFSEDNNKDKTP